MVYDAQGNQIIPTGAAPRRSRNIPRWSTFEQLLRNPDSIGIDTYERMVETDETIGSALEFISLTVIGYLGNYEHPRSRIQKFVNQNIEGMRETLGHVVEEILTGLWAGHSATEIVLTERNGKIVTQDLPTLSPTSFEYKISQGGQNAGYVESLTQFQEGGARVTIGAERFIHWSHRRKFGNPYGVSRLRSAWKYWYPKDVLLGSWARTLERYQAPISVAKTPNPGAMISVDGREIERGEYLTEILSSLSDRSTLVIDPQDEITFLEIKKDFGGDFEAFQNHANRMIFRALLLPSLVFDSGDVGSYAMAQKHFEVFLRAVWQLRAEVARVLIHQWIYRLIVINFGEQTDYGEFKSQILEEEDLKLWSEIFFSLIKAGVIRPELPQDFNWMREKMNLPTGVEPRPMPVIDDIGAGKDGLPGQSPDGLDDARPGVPRPDPKTPTTEQGRPANE